MCKWGTNAFVDISGKVVAVDSCIAPLVDALNKGGIATTGSCCGHGKNHGDILLADGRALMIRDLKEYLAEQGVNKPEARGLNTRQERKTKCENLPLVSASSC